MYYRITQRGKNNNSIFTGHWAFQNLVQDTSPYAQSPKIWVNKETLFPLFELKHSEREV
jgi:hypothetical protein